MSEIVSFRSIIDLWESREALAAALGAGSRTVSKWWQRDRIPEGWWAPIVALEPAQAAGVTSETLMRLAARKASEPTPEAAHP